MDLIQQGFGEWQCRFGLQVMGQLLREAKLLIYAISNQQNTTGNLKTEPWQRSMKHEYGKLLLAFLKIHNSLTKK